VQVALDLGVLGDRLDHHLAVAQVLEVGDHHAGLLNGLPGARGGLLAAGPEHRLAGARRGPRQTARDRPRARYPKPHEPIG
jgi:hypothetical protein